MNFHRSESVSMALIAFWGLCVVGCVGRAAHSQNVVTGKEIYRINRDAIVQILAGDEFGNGFVVSEDGVIFTANHVVTTRDSHYTQYAKSIKAIVFRNGRFTPFDATPIDVTVSADQVNFDYARLKIDSSHMPHVTLGDAHPIEIGDPVTIIPSFPNTGTILLEGIVSGKAAARVDLGPKLTNVVFFQCPVRNGFSGSPIFDAAGNVIGITTTKVFGISLSLDALRTAWTNSAKSGGGIRIMGIDTATSFLTLINDLDQDLISGLGSGVSIEYAKKQQESAK
jgi:S1-C subfamily serine protease